MKEQDWGEVNTGWVYSNEDFMFYIRTGLNKPRLRKVCAIEGDSVTYRFASHCRESGSFTLDKEIHKCKTKTFKKWAKWVVLWTM
jgi:hypothetical protein